MSILVFAVLYVGCLYHQERALDHHTKISLSSNSTTEIKEIFTKYRVVDAPHRNDEAYKALRREKKMKRQPVTRVLPLQETEAPRRVVTHPNMTLPTEASSHRYLIYQGFLHGQGLGQFMSGLLATQLLGDEFNRVVCVQWQDFLHSFRYKENTLAAQLCPHLETLYQTHWEDDDSLRLALINYGVPPNECLLKDRLASNQSVWTVMANTYPQWPSVPPQFLDRFYEFRFPHLLPSNLDAVVHLRVPDSPGSDPRPGLDPNSLQLLGERLQNRSVYLVTNRVAFYEYCESHFGWIGAGWSEVRHSALKKTWGNSNVTLFDETEATARLQKPISRLSPKTLLQQTMADWMALYSARSVYHTASEFSASAVHWSGCTDTHVLNGGFHQLYLLEEAWTNASEPLFLRRELKHCNGSDVTARHVQGQLFRPPIQRKRKMGFHLVNVDNYNWE